MERGEMVIHSGTFNEETLKLPCLIRTSNILKRDFFLYNVK